MSGWRVSIALSIALAYASVLVLKHLAEHQASQASLYASRARRREGFLILGT